MTLIYKLDPTYRWSMAEYEKESNDSLLNPITEDATKDAAAEYPVTYEQLDRALAQVQDVLVERLDKFYVDAWISSGEQNHLANSPEGVFFGFTPTGFANKEYIINLDLSDEVFDAVCQAHRNMAAVWGFDVDRPTSYANTYVDDFQPFYITYPENWLSALFHARIQVMYLLQHEMTPAEALDYWALDFGKGSLTSNKNQDRWYASRGVGREAVSKTRRQAREKMEDSEKQPYYEEQNIEIAELDR